MSVVLLKPRPVSAPAGADRETYCAHYDDCLDAAADWPGFSCEACPVRGTASPSRRDLVDLQATRRDGWEEGTKAQRPSLQRQAAARLARAQLAEQEGGPAAEKPRRHQTRGGIPRGSPCLTCGKPSAHRGYCNAHYQKVIAAERKARGGA